ncbi:O-antigen ligase family protein [Frigidibacter sp. ROC022]|uniref:O-antigen ligase family protein n=1 Tax=Frigidibacter sp. ROC022 TaxID=2971796 RepID=UPI00215A82D0|nr:O-antigen ligase family protein [Frigidibacter sp. ROC022]MCR8726835.1 O-antigen ligase family protein [Frigidibacter sp. ROC022]
MSNATDEIRSPLSAGYENAGHRSGVRQLPLIVPMLLVSLILPFILYLGPLRLSVYRVVLIVAFVPAVVAWLAGHAGRIRIADIALVLLCSWGAISFFVVHGTAGIQAGGMLFIETLGPYLVARVYIRSAAAFRAMVKALFLIVLFLLPFALIEAVTGKDILLEAMDTVWNSYPRVAKDPRWGLQRVQATFEHPILYGVFCGSVIALTYVVLGQGWSFLRRAGATFLVLFTAALTLSAGPLTGMTAQLLLLAWNRILGAVRSRWKLLACIIAAMWIFLEFASNRSPAQIFISYFSFDQHSAYMRLHIWNFGTASILAHPLLGIGFNEWARPSWMRSSIDMYWIVPGVRHGLPAVFFNFAAFFGVVLSLIFRKGLDEAQSACRMGIIFCLIAFFLTGWTVHYWNATYVLFHFLLGSGMWLLDARPEDDAPDIHVEEERPPLRYRRSREDLMSTSHFGSSRQ